MLVAVTVIGSWQRIKIVQIERFKPSKIVRVTEISTSLGTRASEMLESSPEEHTLRGTTKMKMKSEEALNRQRDSSSDYTKQQVILLSLKSEARWSSLLCRVKQLSAKQ